MIEDLRRSAPPLTVLTRSEYFAQLVDLIHALVVVHGELTVRAVQELANQEIITNGIIGAGQRVRERAGFVGADDDG